MEKSYSILKVVCINNDSGGAPPGVVVNLRLTKDKVYTTYCVRTYSFGVVTYQILDDTGDMSTFNSDRFISLEEWRELKLKELNI